MELSNVLLLKVRIVFVFIILLLPFIGISQHLGSIRYTVDDGLTQSEVNSIFQDSRGFLWVGTKFGVSRFDGNEFVSRFDEKGILKSTIQYIDELTGGKVIVASSAGYAIFEPNGNLISFKYPIINSLASYCHWSAHGRLFNAIIGPHDIRIIEATLKGPVDVTHTYSKLVTALKGYSVINLIYDEKRNCFYFTDNKQGTYSFSHSGIIRFDIPENYNFTKGQDGNIYILTAIDFAQSKKKSSLPQWNRHELSPVGLTHGLFLLKGNKTEKVLTFFTSNPTSFQYFLVTKYGKIIIPDPENSQILIFNEGTMIATKLDFDGLSSLYVDDEGSIWMGSANGLLHVFPEYFTNFSKAEGLFPNTKSLVIDKQGVLWVASCENGLQYYKNGKFYTYDLSPVIKSNNSSLVKFNPGSKLDHKGNIHFAISPFFLMQYDGHRMNIDKDWPVGSVYSFYDDTISHKYYYGSSSGIVEQAYGKQKYIVYPVFLGSNSSNPIVSIIRTINGKLLLGGFKSLMILDGHRIYKLPNSTHPDIPGANAMEMDQHANVWIGNGNGIYLFNNKTFVKIENDFFNDLVLSLKCLDSGKLIIGGIRGIGILDLNVFYKTGKASIRYFDKNNGFIGGECQQNCIVRDREGYYWIGATNGIVRIDAAAILNNSYAPRVYLNHVYLNNEREKWSPLPERDFDKGEIKLSSSDNSIRFEYTGICFSSPESMKFSYKLEGFDKHWSKNTTDRQVSYTNLAPGNYTFKVRAFNDSGVWSEKSADFKIHVKASLWQRWYFYLFIIVLFFAVLSIGIARYLERRTRLIREHLEVERRFAELQFKTLRNQLAPHFIFNALNAIGSSIYQNDKEKSYDFLQQFATLIRSTLVHADKSYRTLKEEIDFVKNYLNLEQFRFEDKFEYKVHISEDVDLDVAVPKMIIQTFAENAIKHGLVQKSGKGLLSIHISMAYDHLIINVEDNGIGRSESSKYNSDSTGKGMEIINEFITLFNRFNEKKIQFDVQDLVSENQKNTGTRVTIKLPIDFTYNSINQPNESV